MGYRKSNDASSLTLAKINVFSKSVNITSIIKRNKIEEQKEKLLKIFSLAVSFGLIILLVVFKLL